MRDTPIIHVGELDLGQVLSGIGIAKPTKGKRYKKDPKDGHVIRYLDIVCAFDIETSKMVFPDVDNHEHAWMYIWQFQFGDRATVIGRTWLEFLVMAYELNEILHGLGGDTRLMVYVHNLAYEFQFISGIWPFAPESVFATDRREPLYCMMNQIELRCSARLSGYSLDVWAKDLCVDHQKLKSNLDHSVVRYPWSELTEQELAYCVNDVVSVVECVLTMLHSYGDTLNSIPYTSTGYIRRRVKAAMRTWSPGGIREMQNDLPTYDRLRQAFRGGDTHANKSNVGALLADVWSFDRSSSYPDVIVHCKFPMSRFREIAPSWDAVRSEIERGRCVMMKIQFYNIRLRDPLYGDPYIDADHCKRTGFTRPINAVEDNKRISSADYLEIAITDIDLEIIQTVYEYDGANIAWAMSARYGYLPQPLVDVVIQLYGAKTSLRDVKGREVEYQHSKEQINSVYGMCCQRVIHNPIIYTGDPNDPKGLWKPDPDINRQELYDEAINKTFLNYAWAVWVTAWARYRLFEAIRLVSADNPRKFVYCDTDSIKGTGEIPDLSKINRARIRDAKRSGAYASDSAGKIYYMGVFDYEGTYDWFKTLGAKRYCTISDGVLKITVAGVPKKKGGEIIVNSGGIELFDFDFTFKDSGKLASLYNDDDDFTVTIDGHELRITRNIVLLNVTYQMSDKEGYWEMCRSFQDYIDSNTLSDYNSKW